MTRLFGVHPSENGGVDLAVLRAAHAGANAVQIFTAIPKFYNDKSAVRPERAARFRAALTEASLGPNQVMVHAGYPIHPATDDEAKWSRAAAGLARELERSTSLGVAGVCFHPGSAGKGDRMESTARVARAMTQALDAVSGETRLWVENTAGAGNTIGRTPDEVGAILAAIPERHRHRIGYGLDTCHLFAAGFDIAASPESLAAVLDEFQAVAGTPPAFFHLNDSDGELGSNRDRHRLLGEGQIGLEPFRWLLSDRRTVGVPLILETPAAAEPSEDDSSADPNDAAMVTLLRGLAGEIGY